MTIFSLLHLHLVLIFIPHQHLGVLDKLHNILHSLLTQTPPF